MIVRITLFLTIILILIFICMKIYYSRNIVNSVRLRVKFYENKKIDGEILFLAIFSILVLIDIVMIGISTFYFIFFIS